MWLLVLTAVFSDSGYGQFYSGSLTGVVTDPSGGVIPGAKATLSDVDRGATFTAVTDSLGRFTLRSLPPGNYKLSVEASGFAPFAQSSIVLNVNQNASIDVSLKVGATSQAIEVLTEAPLLATQDAVTGQVVNRTFINDLPLISRAVLDLAYLTPGVTQPRGGAFGPMTQQNPWFAGNFVSNGGRNANSDMLVDGVSVANYEQNGGIQVAVYQPSVDAVQEFKIAQNNFSAEIGFSGGTVINLITRSGTNAFHGSAWEFLRNDKLNANNWFSNLYGRKLPPLRRNQFGLTVGGPIKKDRTFFFFDYEGIRSATFNSRQAGVPSAAMREGDFGEICTQSGGTFSPAGRCSAPQGQLWDPYSGVYSASAGGAVRSEFIPFNNLGTYVSPGSSKLNGTPWQLPLKAGNLIDSAAYKMMQYHPLPNVGVGSPSYSRFLNWIGTGVNRLSGNQWDLKVDHRFSDRRLLNARLSMGRNLFDNFNCFNNPGDPCSIGDEHTGPTGVALNYTETLSPTTVVSASYGFTRGLMKRPGPHVRYKGFDVEKELGLPAYYKSSGYNAVPTIYVYGGYVGADGARSVGTKPWSVINYAQETHHLPVSVSRMEGHHELKFGGEARMHRLNFTQPGGPWGMFYFDFNGSSQLPNTGGGDAMASFLMGFGTGNYEIPLEVSTQNFKYSAFFQDNWRLTDRLTFNLGLRWEVQTPRTERFNRMSWFAPDAPAPLRVPGFGDLRGGLVFAGDKERKPFHTDWKDWGPRFGFAYRLKESTVFRGGYGVFYNPSRVGASGTGTGGFTGFTQSTPWVPTYQSDAATPWARLGNAFPGGIDFPPGSSLGSLTNIGRGVGGPMKTQNATPYTQTWSFGVQRQMPWGILIDTNYVGAKGTRLYFGGETSLSHLGAWVETLPEGEIAALQTFVPNPFYGVITDPQSSLSTATVRRFQLLRPFSHFTGVSKMDSPTSNSIYHGLQLRVEKRLSKGLQFLGNYTFSKSIDDASTGGGGVTWLGGSVGVQNPNRLYLERSLSLHDIAHVLNLTYVYQLPFGRGRAWGKNWNAWVDALLGGWQTNGSWRFDSGQPITLGLQGGQSLPTYGSQRPNLVARLERNAGPNWRDQYFANPQAATRPPRYAIGNAPRTLPVRMPGTNTAALSLFKDIPLSVVREGARIQYRLESFNALNHPQFCGPQSTVNSALFGKVTCQANSPREVQMALKFYW
ncbi:MAG: TonB-dependent receptor [Acidobacteriota bacterium]